MFYLFSQDLARQMVHAKGYWARLVGEEDKLLSTEVLHAGVDIVHAVFDMYRLFDHHVGLTPSQRAHVQPLGYHSQAVVVHQLKTPEQWDSVNRWLDFSRLGRSTCASAATNSEVDCNMPRQDVQPDERVVSLHRRAVAATTGVGAATRR